MKDNELDLRKRILEKKRDLDHLIILHEKMMMDALFYMCWMILRGPRVPDYKEFRI